MAADTEVTDVFDPAAEDESDAPLPGSPPGAVRSTRCGTTSG